MKKIVAAVLLFLIVQGCAHRVPGSGSPLPLQSDLFETYETYEDCTLEAESARELAFCETVLSGGAK